MGVSLPKIQSFVAVADTGQFRKAAQKLHLSQPTITAHVRDLEDKLGAALFSRTTRSVTLTTEGANFLRRVRNVLDDLDGAVLEIREHAQLRRGALVVAATPSVAANLLPSVIAQFTSDYPAVRIEVREDQSYGVEARVESGEADLGIAPLSHRRTDFSFSFLFRDRFVGLAPKGHPLAKRTRIQLAELVSYPLLTTIPESSIRDSVKAVLDARGIALRSDHLLIQHQTVVQMVAAGLGVALLPSVALERLDCSDVTLLKVHPEITRDVGILQRKGGSVSAAATAFLQAWPGLGKRDAKRSF